MQGIEKQLLLCQMQTGVTILRQTNNKGKNLVSFGLHSFITSDLWTFATE